MPVAACPVACFVDNILDEAKPGGQFLLILHHASRVLYHLGHGAQLEVPQFTFLAPVMHEEGNLLEVLGRPIHVSSKIRLDLEEFLEILIQAIEQIVCGGIADKHYFDVERNGLRSK